jgi:hypothetical protein
MLVYLCVYVHVCTNPIMYVCSYTCTYMHTHTCMHANTFMLIETHNPPGGMIRAVVSLGYVSSSASTTNAWRVGMLSPYGN